jgi:uncharacterized membrane protein
MKVEESITINRSPEDVFAFFNVRENDIRWMASVIESEWLDPAAPTGVGRRGRMLMDAMGRREFIDEVTEFEPGRRVAHRSVSDSMVFHSACVAEPEGESCRVTFTYTPERLPGGLFGRITAPFTSMVVRRNYRADLARLKDLLETERRAHG